MSRLRRQKIEGKQTGMIIGNSERKLQKETDISKSLGDSSDIQMLPLPSKFN
jgi:hypothetical protein